MQHLRSSIYGAEAFGSNSNLNKKAPIITSSALLKASDPMSDSKNLQKGKKCSPGPAENKGATYSSQGSNETDIKFTPEVTENKRRGFPSGNAASSQSRELLTLQLAQHAKSNLLSPVKTAESQRSKSRKQKNSSQVGVQISALSFAQSSKINPESLSLIGCRLNKLVPTLVTEEMRRATDLFTPKEAKLSSPELGSPIFSSPSKMSARSQTHNCCGVATRSVVYGDSGNGALSSKSHSKIGGISTSNWESGVLQPAPPIGMTTTSLMCDEISGLSESEREPFDGKSKHVIGATSSGNFNCEEVSYNSGQLLEAAIAQGFVADVPLRCQTHKSELVQFMCCFPACQAELCGVCILNHSFHINHIKTVQEVLATAVKSLEEGSDKQADSERSEVAKKLEQLDNIQADILGFFKDKFYKIRREITAENRYLGDQTFIRDLFKHQSKKTTDTKTVVSTAMLGKLKNYLMRQSNPRGCTLLADVDLVKSKLQEIFDDHLRLVRSSRSFETTETGKPKYLHWVEWGKKKLYIYDAIKNHTRPVDLDVNFKMPAFSRTVVVPSGELYLLGGEEPELTVRDEIYCIDIPEYLKSSQPPKITVKSRMPRNKYDFTCCHMDGYIYVISGKDRTSEVVADCERYNTKTDSWDTIAKVKTPRFAASSCAAEGSNKIYLFGGRAEGGNDMVQTIEQYCAVQNVWKVVELKNPTIWIPVEICGIAQIDEHRILVFGGSDVKVRDTASCYVFNSSENSITKITDLRKPQVFVSPSLIFGSKVYAFGNEYYAKHKNLHRFSIDLMGWEFIM